VRFNILRLKRLRGSHILFVPIRAARLQYPEEPSLQELLAYSGMKKGRGGKARARGQYEDGALRGAPLEKCQTLAVSGFREIGRFKGQKQPLELQWYFA
jgi:hypothetical protein